MKSHSENILPPKLLAKYLQGDVLGYDEVDQGLSSKVETWNLVKHPTEVAVFKKIDFDVIFLIYSSKQFVWSQQEHNNNAIMVGIVKSHSIFSFLCEQTIYLLAFELIKVKKYPPGSLIMSQSKRSPLNTGYKAMFEHRMNNLQIAMKEQNEKLVAVEEDIKVSQYGLMMQQLSTKINQKLKERDRRLRPDLLSSPM